MLFAVVALMVGISCGQQVAKVTINAGWLVASYGGTAAVVFGLVWFFTDLSKPDRQVAVYRVVTPSGDDIPHSRPPVSFKSRRIAVA